LPDAKFAAKLATAALYWSHLGKLLYSDEERVTCFFGRANRFAQNGIGLVGYATIYSWKILLSVGLMGNGAPAFLFAIAQTKIDSSLAGMLNSLVPILTLTFGLLLFGLRTWLLQVIGLVIGFVGAVMLIVMPGGISGFQPEALLVVVASMCYAFNLNVVRKFLPTMPSMLITAGSFLWVGPFCIIYLFSTDFITRFEHEYALQSFGAIAILAVVGTTLAVLMFNKLIQSGGAVFASMVTYIVPVVAIIWGVFDGESISYWSVLGVVIILGGVYLVNKPSHS
jgi:drug/metabolite transporter (DMT)-like permease